jgi:hypothetical protein
MRPLGWLKASAEIPGCVFWGEWRHPGPKAGGIHRGEWRHPGPKAGGIPDGGRWRPDASLRLRQARRTSGIWNGRECRQGRRTWNGGGISAVCSVKTDGICLGRRAGSGSVPGGGRTGVRGEEDPERHAFPRHGSRPGPDMSRFRFRRGGETKGSRRAARRGKFFTGGVSGAGSVPRGEKSRPGTFPDAGKQGAADRFRTAGPVSARMLR